MGLHCLDGVTPLIVFSIKLHTLQTKSQQTPLPESASELYQSSDRRLLAKLVPNSADRECGVVSVTDPYRRIIDFLDMNRYFSIK
jgi:hypothetical protein